MDADDADHERGAGAAAVYACLHKHEPMKEYRILSRNALRYIAMAAMLADHIGELFFTGTDTAKFVLRDILGRIAYPIFGILLIEGMYRTDKPEKHLLWLFVTAIISEPAYDLMAYGKWIAPEGQNILWLYLMIAAFIVFLRKIKNKYIKVFGGAVIGAGICVISYMINVDYTIIGAVGMLIAAVMVYRKTDLAWGTLVIGGCEWLIGANFMCLVPAAIMLFYDPGKPCRRSKTQTVCFYAFYPVHMLCLKLISVII